MVGIPHRQHRPGRGVLSGPGSHRWRPGDQLRFHQYPLGGTGGEPGDLSYRPADQLLRGALRGGHGSAHPRCRLRLHRLDHHLADLRQLHLSVLRPGSGDHGAGAGTVLPHSAGPGLCHLLDHRHPPGDLWHHPDQSPAALEPAALADPAAVALCLRHRQESRGPGGLDHLRRPRRRGRGLQPAVLQRRLYRGPRPGDPGGRTGRLPALSAGKDRAESPALVGRAADGRSRLDSARRAEDAGRRLSGLSCPAARDSPGARRRTHPDVPGRLGPWAPWCCSSSSARSRST